MTPTPQPQPSAETRARELAHKIFHEGDSALEELAVLYAERDSFKAKAEALDWLELNQLSVQCRITGDEINWLVGSFKNQPTLLSAITTAQKESDRAPIESPGSDPKPASEADPSSHPEA